MTRHIAFCYCALLTLLFCSSCREDEDLLPQGGITLSLAELSEQVYSRSVPADLGGFVPDKFNLEIKNEVSQKVAYYGAFTDKPISLPPATYEVKAYYGENVPLGLDAPYFEGFAHSIKVLSNENTSVSIACKVANALLSVRYVNASLFDDLYSSYRVIVRSGGMSVNIEDAAKSAYFQAGSSISVSFEGVLKENGQRILTALHHERIPSSVDAGQHIILSLSQSNVQPAISKVEVVAATITAEIPVTWLPKPKLEPVGFVDNCLMFAETESKTARVNFKLSKSLEDVKFQFNFEDTHHVDLNDKDYFLSNPDDHKRLEEIFGQTLPKVGDKSAGLDFSQLIEKLQTNGGEATNNSVTIDVKANQRWSSENQSVNRVYRFQCVKPQFSVSCYPGRIWTKEFTINALSHEDIVSGNIEKLKSDLVYQYSVDKEKWQNYPSGSFRLDGLNPNSIYYVRALYRGEIASAVTEVRTNVDDNSLNTGFEVWSYENSPAWVKYWKRWFLNDKKDVLTEGWCSLNTLTTSDNSLYAYCSNSGTEPSSDKRSGSYAAEVKTIGWGSGTTAVSPISVIKKVSPGEVFLGKMSGNAPVYGFNGFRSRPTGLRFYYKYVPEGNHKFLVEISLYSKSGIIASNTFEGGKADIFTEYTLNFVYDEAQVKEEVAGIKVRFTSGDNTKDEVDKAFVLSSARHVGNKLYLDDVSLVYDK